MLVVSNMIYRAMMSLLFSDNAMRAIGRSYQLMLNAFRMGDWDSFSDAFAVNCLVLPPDGIPIRGKDGTLLNFNSSQPSSSYFVLINQLHLSTFSSETKQIIEVDYRYINANDFPKNQHFWC